ncbi:MAG: 3-isopropylmalate dehydratase small subunit [Spirochaetes bacterium]|nr:3-isopropylmalate dehydratase small subunit [Spirochaetota bacterium]
MKEFKGKVLFLDRSDINTDEIIPAKYLTEITKEALKPYLLEDLKLPAFDSSRDLKDVRIVISRANFGCGSSREHAPWAFEVNGINVVIAENFARIFRQNMFNCGMCAIELKKDDIEKLFADYSSTGAEAEIDLNGNCIIIKNGGKSGKFSFEMSEYDKALVLAGGWVGFADKKY